MLKILSATALLAIAVASPASAQILGGSGGLAGGLGGTIGGTLGGGGFGGMGPGMLGSTIDRAGRDLPRGDDLSGNLRGSTRSERSVDTRKGHVKASNDSSFDSTVANTARIGDRAISGKAAVSGSRSSSVDAQLIGTDAVRDATGQAVGRTRDAAATLRDRTTGTADRVRETGSNAVGRVREGTSAAASRTRDVAGSVSGRAAGTAEGAAMLGRGTLAMAGSAAANGQGSFPVALGMPVTDPKGRVIGTVQSLRTAGSGEVQQVLVKMKDKTATLPATNFTGSGDVLVSAMGKAEVKKAAE